MNWNERYATGEVMGDISSKSATDLSSMAKDLNSHIFSYTGQSGQSPTDRMYKGNKGADLDNQPYLANLLSKYNKSSTGAIGKAVQQIGLFTGKDSYGSDIRTNREKFPEFHSLMDQASPIAGGLSRGTVLTDVRHGTPGSPIDISQHYKVGDKMTTQVTSATSDPELAKNWVLDDKQRFDQAKSSGDNSVLDQKYNGARHGAFVVQHFPAGIKGLQVAPLSAVPEHNEVVPQAGQKLKVSRVEGPDESGVHHIHYEHDNDNDNNTMGTTSMNWNERYSMAKGDSISTLVDKITQRSITPQHLTALDQYHRANGHSSKAETSQDNQNRIRDNARNGGHGLDHAIANWWGELREAHETSAATELPKESETPAQFPAQKKRINNERMKYSPGYIGGEDNNGWMSGTSGPSLF